MLTNHQLAGRKIAARNARVRMLCRRLDLQIQRAEKFKRGRTREMWLAKAAATREKLRQIDH